MSLPGQYPVDPLTAPAVGSGGTSGDVTVPSLVGVADPTRLARNASHSLATARLGIASSLYMALRAKNAAVADHSLRVALICSAWSSAATLPEEQRDLLEIAALLHDIGKIGVPDSILTKRLALLPHETSILEQHHLIGRQILAGCCGDNKPLMDIASNVGAWYDGSHPLFHLSGDEIPFGARLIAIVDAFDAATNDLRAGACMTRDEAISTLRKAAGSRFDPLLVEFFVRIQNTNMIRLDKEIASRWLNNLGGKTSYVAWKPGEIKPLVVESHETLFHRKLLDNMHDGVIFIDAKGIILQWNRSAERLTGLSAGPTVGKTFVPSLINLRDDQGAVIHDSNCPVLKAIAMRVQSLSRMYIRGRGGGPIAVNLHVCPIIDSDSETWGATVVLADASSEIHLEERVQSLHEKATRDPLTRVSNRAEFDRVLALTVQNHLEGGRPCSLIICDIDRFKSINDTFGHQAGDEALVSFAAILAKSCRQGDLVARYGGEEFVMVCGDCDAKGAVELAEKVRAELSQTPLSELKGRCITASFGVAELQNSDNPEAILRRADHALLHAKESGRNRVIYQDGRGGKSPQRQTASTSFNWWPWNTKKTNSPNSEERYLTTNVPIDVVAEKLRGFVDDHKATVIEVNPQRLVVRISSRETIQQRRYNDRPVPFLMELTFYEDAPDDPARRATVVRVVASPVRGRDRRWDPVTATRQLLNTLRSYLMAQDFQPQFNNDGTPQLTSIEDALRAFLN